MKNLKKRNLFTLPDWLLNQIIKKNQRESFYFQNQSECFINPRENDVISQEIMKFDLLFKK